MENKIAHYLAGKLNVYIGRDGIAFTKIVLGMEVLIINITKVIIVYLLAVVLGVVSQTFALHVAYIFVKRHSFGLHALNSVVCTMVSCSIFVLVPWALRGAGIGNVAVGAVFAVVVFCLYRYAPADTKARPIIGSQTRRRLKIRAVACGVVLGVVAVLVPSSEFKLLLTLGALFQCVSILPIAYKILKRSEKNYEKYE